jgi:hypothetical protein
MTYNCNDPTTNKIVFDESILGLQGVKDVSPSFDTSVVIRLNLPIIGKNSALKKKFMICLVTINLIFMALIVQAMVLHQH